MKLAKELEYIYLFTGKQRKGGRMEVQLLLTFRSHSIGPHGTIVRGNTIPRQISEMERGKKVECVLQEEEGR